MDSISQIEAVVIQNVMMTYTKKKRYLISRIINITNWKIQKGLLDSFKNPD